MSALDADDLENAPSTSAAPFLATQNPVESSTIDAVDDVESRPFFTLEDCALADSLRRDIWLRAAVCLHILVAILCVFILCVWLKSAFVKRARGVMGMDLVV